MQAITDFWNNFLNGLPDVVAGLLVLILAVIIAKLARAAVQKMFKWFGIERLLAKSGIEKKHIEQSRAFIGKLVQLVVFVLFLPGIFGKLGLDAVSTPITTMMNGLYAYLPNIVAGIIVLMIGLFVAKMVKELVRPLIKKANLEAKLEKLGVNTKKVDISDIVSTGLYILIAILFVVESFNVFQLDILTKIGGAVIGYLPTLIAALLVIAVALILGQYVEKVIVEKFNGSKTLGLLGRVLVIIFGLFMMFDQLGIAKSTVNEAFIIILGAVGVAFAVAFGIGGKGFAERQLKKLEVKIDSKKK